MPLLYDTASEAARWTRQQRHAFTHSRRIAQDLSATDPHTAADNRYRSKEIAQMTAEATAPLHSQSYCGRGTVVVAALDGSKITIVPTRCKTWGCKRCGPILARIWGERIADAKPSRFITLTADASRFANADAAYLAMKEAWPLLVRIIRKKIGPFEYALVWELHESGYPHMHICQRGNYIPQRWLARTWLKLGIGQVVDIRSISTRRGVARYATKYMMKTVQRTRETYGLTKVITASRGFFAKRIHTPDLPNATDTRTTHTLAHPADCIENLMRRYGWELASDPGSNAFVLVPGSGPASQVPLADIFASLPRQ